MMHPRSPQGGELNDVMDVDAEIEALRRGSRQSADPVLSLLAGLRDDIDTRTAVLLGQVDSAGPVNPAHTAQTLTGTPGWNPDSAAARRRLRSRRLVVFPAAAMLVLGSTGVAAALSGSQQAPLYPLHQLIFGSATSSDGQIARDLAAAGKLLDHAAGLPLEQRKGSLTQAQVILSEARRLLPAVSSATARTRLSHEITLTGLRAQQLARPPAPTVLASPGPAPQTLTPSASPAAEEPSAAVESEDSSAPRSPAAAGELEPRSGTESEPAELPAPRTTSAPSADPSPAPAASELPGRPEGGGSSAIAAEPESEGSEAPDS